MTKTDLGSGHLPQYSSSVSIKTLEYLGVGRPFVYPEMYHAILSIGRKDLKPPTLVESLDLTGLLSAGSPALTLCPNVSVHSSIVYED